MGSGLLDEGRWPKCLKQAFSATPVLPENSSQAVRSPCHRTATERQDAITRHGAVIHSHPILALLDLDPGIADHATPALLLNPDIAVELFGGTGDHHHPLIGRELLERLGLDRNGC